MNDKQSEVEQVVNQLYRKEYGKLVSVLTKTFGIDHMDMAEDVVQEAMFEAVKQWSLKGIPDNASGWIYRVAKNKAVNIVNQEKYKRAYTTETAHFLQSEWTAEPALNHIFSDEEIADDQLRMMFACCHPAISEDSQVALTLKTLCGFSIPEIAHAFLTTEENINKRLVRARKRIREANISFEVPPMSELEARLKSVLETIYLLFNEGYNATSGNDLVRYELCEEAIHLTEIIASNPHTSNESQVFALLSLMSLNASRFQSRTDEHDHILDLEHQDRSQWDRSLIQKGLYYLEFAAQKKEISLYHILAAISAHHCTAKDYASTDWKSILNLYDSLIQLDASPIVLLNRAIVLSKTTSPAEGIKAIEKIQDQSFFQSYLPYYTAKAQLHFQNHEAEKGVELLEIAMDLPMQEKIKELIISDLGKYSKKR